jgi:hypothetical protein
MAQLSYDIVAHDGGWAIVILPGPGEGFATQQAAFDTAAGLARKLRFVGYTMQVAPRDDVEGSAGPPSAASA